MKFVLAAIPYLGKLGSWLAGFSTVAKILGGLSWLGPWGSVIGSALTPIVDGISRFVVYAIQSVFEGIKISLSNIAAFWIIYPLVFVAGGFYFGHLDPIGAKAAKTELRAAEKQIVELKKELPAKKQTKPERKASPNRKQ